ncbi:MAG: nucleotide exchange factor GrpE [Verrucomicrobia bacterium CG_4_10_14_3_um_filter_43_23]|nr:MAG: nucleotide exchange factor GrpE [Verrucomicrobia bacterium CG22_combo_CG10-13_8_21_14_all_43_17]PIX58464.1 MAG: nucleotide exchange factor GrpE [Verrucomicrobia bacterium CG_4_10_14_3_um_filter_43_23]PIY63188.1 MAG: nucleotide exchange factor GrpE [Verrucomicrobia bacterium CG_4_10_14_0_8_um_filter_43_34]PJA44907.1 MAG: nucleotide exchange factor GrpE [Verrucomicrobia bacterium CG_4_9_14_3_um_filter_43_20]
MSENNPNAETTESSFEENDMSQVAGLLKRIDALQEEANNNKEHYMRAMADLENYRRRVVREKNDLRISAISGLIEELLPVVDNLQLGLKSANEHHESSDVINGFQMVLDRMLSVLKNQGVEMLNPLNEAFDPHAHECIAHMPHATLPEGHVSEVVRIGYRFNERLIRPASVVVSNGKAPEAPKS